MFNSPLTRGLRGRLMFTLLLAFVMLAGLIVWQSLVQREVLIESALERLLAHARLGAARQQALIDHGDALLDSLIDSPALKQAGGAGCNAELADRLRSAPGFIQITKATPEGNMLCAALSTSKDFNSVNWSDRAWFQQALRSPELVVSEVTFGRIVQKRLITLAKSERDASGTPRAVYFLSLPLDWLQEALLKSGLPENTQLLVHDAQGTVVVSYPKQEGWLGRRFSEAFMQQLRATGGEGTMVTTGLDGSRRVIAYTPLLTSESNQSYYLRLSQPRALIEAPAQRQMLTGLGVALAILALTLGLLFWGANRYLVGPLRKLSATARRFGTGDLTVRGDLPNTCEEIGELARALDTMARALAEGTVSRQRLQDEIDRHAQTAARLRMALQGTGAGIFEWNIGTGDTGQGSGSTEVWLLDGLAPDAEPLDHEAWRRSVHPDSLAQLEEKLADAIARRADIEIEWRVNLPAGAAPRWLMSRARLQPEAGGRLLRYQGITLDVTRHKLAEQQLRDSEALFRSIFDNNLDAMLLTTPDGGILGANARAHQLFGWTEEELRQQGRRSIVDPDDPRLGPALAQRQAQGWFRGELTMRDKAGRSFPAELSSSVFVGRDGQRMTSMQVRDITERQRKARLLQEAKAEADRANEAKSRFLAAASHDLRQPLAALSLYASLLRNAAALPANQRKLVANMQVCIDSLSELLSDLLDLSKLEAGVVAPMPSDFAISRVLESLATMHTPEAQAKGLGLRFRPSLLTVRTDPVLLQRCLGNLVVNALRYTERGGVLVACRRRQGRLWVEVWDTGIGIAPDKTAEIFEEFRQLGGGAQSKGSGLGLAIVARTAALLGLRITVRSRPGRGSVFAIELPPGQAALAQPLLPPAPAAPLRLRRIALVEDNDMLREIMAEALRFLDHEVLACATQSALLAELDAFAPDIVISDYRLTGNDNGVGVIAAVRARLGPEFAALLLTGDTDPQLLRAMVSRNIIVMHKPVELDALLAFLQEPPAPVA